MVINTTGNNGSVVGVTGVHPDNIGKGIKWDEATKKYVVNVKAGSGIVINDDGELEVKFSNDPSNLVRIKDDGVYYGVTPDKTELYVDALNGNDITGTGDILSPYRTIKKALSVIRPKTTGTQINIKEGQIHNVYCEKGTIDFSALIFPYGEKLNEIERTWNPAKTGWRATLADEYLSYRPVLNFIPNYKISPEPDKFSPSCWEVTSGNVFFIMGCQFAIDMSKPIVNNRAWKSVFLGLGSVHILDCTIRNAGWGGKAFLLSDNENGELKVFMKHISATSLNTGDVFGMVNVKLEVNAVQGLLSKTPQMLDGVATGWHWTPTISAPTIVSMFSNVSSPTTVSKNFVTNA